MIDLLLISWVSYDFFYLMPVKNFKKFLLNYVVVFMFKDLCTACYSIKLKNDRQ